MRELIIIPLAIFIVILFAAVAFRFGSPSAKKGVAISVGGHPLIVEVADTMTSRSQGLSGREPLPSDGGMLFAFSKPGNYGFWMKDMKFALDFVWVNGATVVGMNENVPTEPNGNILTYNHYYPPEPADKVLEVNAGTVARLGIRVGDTLEYAP